MTISIYVSTLNEKKQWFQSLNLPLSSVFHPRVRLCRAEANDGHRSERLATLLVRTLDPALPPITMTPTRAPLDLSEPYYVPRIAEESGEFDDSHLDVMNGKFWGYLTYMWVICCENVGQFFGMSHYDLTWWFGSGEASPNGRTFQLFSGWWIIMIQPDGFWWLAKLRFLKNNVAPMS